MVWWVAYHRGSFNLKERYPCRLLARGRYLDLFAKAQFLRVVPGNDVEGLAALAHCLELPPVPARKKVACVRL